VRITKETVTVCIKTLLYSYQEKSIFEVQIFPKKYRYGYHIKGDFGLSSPFSATRKIMKSSSRTKDKFQHGNSQSL